MFSFAFGAAIFHRELDEVGQVVLIALTMYIKLCIFVYILCIIVYIVVTPVIVFDLSRINKFIINHHETSIYMVHTRYIVSFATRQSNG